MFDSLKCAKKLEEVGVPRHEAEAHVQIMSELMETNLATKEDIKDVRKEIQSVRIDLQNEIQSVRNDLQSEIQSVRHEVQLLKQEMVMVEQRLTIKLGTIVSLAIGVAVTLSKLAG